MVISLMQSGDKLQLYRPNSDFYTVLICPPLPLPHTAAHSESFFSAVTLFLFPEVDYLSPSRCFFVSISMRGLQENIIFLEFSPSSHKV